MDPLKSYSFALIKGVEHGPRAQEGRHPLELLIKCHIQGKH